MSVKINGYQQASPAAPGQAAQESKGSQRSRRPSIFSNLSFTNAPKSNSTSMAPRAKTPLLSPEEQAARSDGSTSGSKAGLMKSAMSTLSHAADKTQKTLSGGAKLVSTGMRQAGKAMSNAYQALNEPKYTRLHSDYSQEHQAQPQTAPTTPTTSTGARPRPDFDALVARDDGLQQSAAARKNQGPAPWRQPEVRPEARMAENVRPRVNGQENGQGGRPQGADRLPGRNTQAQTPSRPLATSRPTVHNAPSERNPPSVPAKTAERAPLGVHTGNVPQLAARHRPAAGGAENANPNVGRPSPHAAVKKNTPPLVASFSTDRPLGPKQLVEAMVNLAKGTDFEGAVSKEIARNPEWGQQMQQRWNTLRLSVADAKDDGNTQVPSLESMVARRPVSFIKFMGGGDESSFARLMRPRRQTAPAQTPAQPSPLQERPPAVQARPSAAPEVPTHAHSARPQGRVDTRQESQGPQASHTGHAAEGPGRNERKPVDERTELTAKLGNLDDQIAASEQKGKEILHRMFNEPTGAERAAATRESYAHKKEHNELIVRRDQVQAQLQHVGTNAAARQLVGKLNDVDGKIAELEQRAGHLNKVMERLPRGSEKWVAARNEKNSLRPAWKELTSQRADMQAKLEGLRPEFQQARELAKGLTELAQVKGGELRQSRDGSKTYLDRSTIENHYERFDQSRHLLNKRGDLENAKQQLNRLIDSGMLEGIAPNERRELKQLAELDIGDQFSKLNDLKGTVAEIRGALKAMGAGGLYEGIRTTPEQRAHDDAEARRSQQDAIDNGY